MAYAGRPLTHAHHRVRGGTRRSAFPWSPAKPPSVPDGRGVGEHREGSSPRGLSSWLAGPDLMSKTCRPTAWLAAHVKDMHANCLACMPIAWPAAHEWSLVQPFRCSRTCSSLVHMQLVSHVYPHALFRPGTKSSRSTPCPAGGPNRIG